MKKFATYTLATLMAFGMLPLMTSCSEDSLDIEQKGVTPLSIYETGNDADLMSFISGIYTRFHGDYSSSSANFGGDGSSCYNMFIYHLTRMSDEDSDGYAYNESADGMLTESDYSFFYTICYWSNMIIDRVPNNTVASTELKNRVVAEARGMRAIAMMYLVQLWGDAPLADHVMNGTEGNTPAAESWAWIEKELDEAAAALPSKSGVDGQKAIGGRLTREACLAYKGKAQLWQGNYSAAAQTLGQVIGSGLYALEENFDNLNLSASDFGPENIFEFNFDDSDEFLGGQEGSMDIYGFGSNAVMCYGVTFPLLYLNWGNGSNPTQELYNFYVAHDGVESPRMNGCVLSKETFNAVTMSMNAMSFPIAINQGYFRMRNICRAEDKVGTFPQEFNKKNSVYLRYAEVLLDYAEAVCNGGSASSISGLEALNMVRRRAGLQDAASLDMNDATYGIKTERRAELYREGVRYIDCVRWGDAKTAFANTGTATYQFGGEGEAGNYTFTATPTGFGGWKDRYAHFPFPASDVNNNPNLNQNTGW